MDNRQARALVLLAGNGAVLIFASQFVTENWDWVLADAEHGRDPNNFPGLIITAAVGVAFGYFALLAAPRRETKLEKFVFDLFELISAAAFFFVIYSWIGYLLELAGW